MKNYLTMVNVIDYLKGPELVIKFQTLFGVKYLNEHYSENSKAYRLHKRNVSDQSSTGEETDEGFIEPKEFGNNDNIDRKYEITNRFWYYLFVIATELGGLT